MLFSMISMECNLFFRFDLVDKHMTSSKIHTASQIIASIIRFNCITCNKFRRLGGSSEKIGDYFKWQFEVVGNEYEVF